MILHQTTTDKKVIPLSRFGQGVTPHMVVSGHTMGLSSVTLSLGATPCRSCCRCLPHALFRKILAAYRWLACSTGSLIELGKLGVTLSGDLCDTYDFTAVYYSAGTGGDRLQREGGIYTSVFFVSTTCHRTTYTFNLYSSLEIPIAYNYISE
jgi:hypothetical protein